MAVQDSGEKPQDIIQWNGTVDLYQEYSMCTGTGPVFEVDDSQSNSTQ